MEKIELNKKLLEQKPIYNGYESSIYKDNDILYKIFKTDNKKLLDNKMKKLELISNKIWLEKCFVSMPINLIMADDNFIGYTAQYKPGFEEFNSFEKDTQKKVEYLKRIKELIVQLHINNILFGDIRHCNILSKNGNMRFSNYDNISIGDYGFDTTNYAEDIYINELGIDENLDIYMYNLLVISNFTNIVESYVIDYVKDNGLPDILDNYHNNEVIDAMINLNNKDNIQFFKFKEKRYHLL